MNAYLIDTHVLLWWLFNDSRLSCKAQAKLRELPIVTNDPALNDFAENVVW